MFGLLAVFAAVPGLRRCGCCGGVYLRRRVRGLAATPGVICRTAPGGRRRPCGKTTLIREVLRGVDVTLLYIDGCPNWEVAGERLREALARAGRDHVRVEHRLVTTAEQADAARFRGSPTVLVNGQDPFADPDAPTGLSCRVFRGEAGLTGAPTVEQLLAVLS
jgi:hypothetical protein